MRGSTRIPPVDAGCRRWWLVAPTLPKEMDWARRWGHRVAHTVVGVLRARVANRKYLILICSCALFRLSSAQAFCSRGPKLY